MKRSKEKAQRWLKLAEYYWSAKKNFEVKISYVFMCEQYAQKTLKFQR
jgi:HEPN domain-containing protein